jgi:hypothetical protein
MIQKKPIIGIVVTLGLLLSWNVMALDYGLVISTEPGYSSPEGEHFYMENSLTPWVSSPLWENASLYASFKGSLDYEQEEWNKPLVLELGRTELHYRPTSTLSFALGRQNFADSAGLIAEGLFDGLSGSYSLGKARLSAGVYYTGLQYKKTAEIMMAPNDVNIYSKKLDYSEFKDTYFASRRLAAALGGELPDVTERSSLSLDLIAQFDLNDYDDVEGSGVYHSQYLAANYQHELLDTLNLTLGAAAGIAEAEEYEDEDEAMDDPDAELELKTRFGFAIRGGAEWRTPTPLQDLAALELVYASGRKDDNRGAFTPITTITLGEIFSPSISSLVSIRAKYTVRLIEQVSAEGSFAYFIRTETDTFYLDPDLDPDSDSKTLGGELFGRLTWAPDPDIRLTFNIGAFFPRMGKAFDSDAKARFKTGLNLIIS